jgi:ArsR family transcriptional regulator, arsenate/arsenite/antimonite-responsive transcriptional repressor
MKNKEAVQALLALGQETRLNLFRLVVQKGQQGLTPGQMVEALGVPSPTLSFHLKELVSAGLLKVERQSRNLIYSPSADRIEALSGFLLENCCGGQPCSPGTLGKKLKKLKKKATCS